MNLKKNKLLNVRKKIMENRLEELKETMNHAAVLRGDDVTIEYLTLQNSLQKEYSELLLELAQIAYISEESCD